MNVLNPPEIFPVSRVRMKRMSSSLPRCKAPVENSEKVRMN